MTYPNDLCDKDQIINGKYNKVMNVTPIMIINDLEISNLFSYEKTKVSFSKYNVITGVNAVGKSNLIRLLKIIITSGKVIHYV
jgi:hypothetical protein